jgi:hypothetical protein
MNDSCVLTSPRACTWHLGRKVVDFNKKARLASLIGIMMTKQWHYMAPYFHTNPCIRMIFSFSRAAFKTLAALRQAQVRQTIPVGPCTSQWMAESCRPVIWWNKDSSKSAELGRVTLFIRCTFVHHPSGCGAARTGRSKPGGRAVEIYII